MNNMIIETRISGIPCQAEMTYFVDVPAWTGSKFNCPSDWDYYGYAEIEFIILDRKGYSAEWLEKKMSEEDVERIKSELIQATKETEYD